MKNIRISALLGLAITGIGITVLAGAAFNSAALVALLPSIAYMGLSTALCFVIAGSSLWMPSSVIRRFYYREVAGIMLILITGFRLLQFMGLLPAPVEAFPDIGADWPGSLSLAASLVLLMAGMVLIFLNRLKQRAVLLLVQGALVGMLVIPVLGVFGYFIGLPLFYGEGPKPSLMALPATLVLLLLALALGLQLREDKSFRAYYTAREDRKIFALNVLLFYFSVMVTGITVAVVLAEQNMQTLRSTLHNAARANALFFQSAIKDAVGHAVQVATLSDFRNAMRRPDVPLQDGAVQQELDRFALMFHEETVKAIRVLDTKEAPVASIGEFMPLPDFHVALRLQHDAQLFWQDGWRLQVKVPLDAGSTRVGYVIMQLVLPRFDAQLGQDDVQGKSGEVIVCADKGVDAIQCFPSTLPATDFHMHRRSAENVWPAAQVLEKQRSIELIIDRRGVEVVAAYMPIEGLGLGLIQKIDAAEVYAPVRKNLLLATLAALLISVAGALFLYWRVYPLVRELNYARAYTRDILDNIPEGVVTMDENGLVQTANATASQLFGYEPESMVGRNANQMIPEYFGGGPGAMDAASEHGVSCLINAGSRETTGKRLDGTEFNADLVVSEFIFEGERHFVGIIRDITERKHNENALRQSEALLSQVLELLPVGVWVTDENGQIIRNNPAGEQIWHGARRTGRKIYGERKAWWADSGKRIEPDQLALTRALSRGETSIGEVIEIECYDGSHKIILNSAMPLRGQNGEIQGAIAVNEDITASRRVQEELRLSRETFQHAFESAAIGISMLDTDGRFLMVNRALADITGYTEDELLTRSFHDITHPDDLGADVGQAARLLAGEIRAYQMEKRYFHKAGHIVWILLAVALVRDSQGTPLNFIAQIMDITARKQAEEALRASQASLANAQRIAGIGDWEWDILRGVTYWSDEVYRIRGFDPAQGAASQELFLSTMHPEDAEFVQQAIRQAMHDGHFYGVDYRIIRPDGAVRFVHSQGEVIYDDRGRPVKMVGTTQDITERKEIEQELLASRQELRDLAAHRESVREDERKRIAREVHDELGQLLTALKMDVSLLRMQFRDNPEVQSRADAMRDMVEKTVRVVRHVATNLRPAALNLGVAPALEWLAENFSQRTGIRCTLAFDEECANFDDNIATAVFRIVQEALTNVSRHAKAHSVEISFVLSANVARLQIRDDGCGFEPAAITNQASFGLLGIRERALMLGGEFNIDSAPGKGTVILVEIPAHNRGTT